MDIKKTSLRDWYESLGQLVDVIGDNSFPNHLFEVIGQIVNFDDGLVLAYKKDNIPVILHDQLHPNDREIFYKSYLAGAYVASPFYQAFIQGYPSGVYKVKEIAPDRFYQSEYFRTYYKHIGALDLVSYLFQMPDNWALLISIGRRFKSQKFKQSDIKRLAEVEPLLRSLSERHWQNPWHITTESQSIHQHFLSCFEEFGAAKLTQREIEVAKLLLLGHSSKSVANELSITLETVRVHRKNIYSKLQIRSYGELFSLFISNITPT